MPDITPYRIRLIHTNDEYTNLRPGDEGLVTHEPHPDNPYDTYWVKWDSGSTLGMIPDVDRFEIIP